MAEPASEPGALPWASGQPHVPLSYVLYEMLGGRTAVYRE